MFYVYNKPESSRSFIASFKNLGQKFGTDGRTDRQTDGRTDRQKMTIMAVPPVGLFIINDISFQLSHESDCWSKREAYAALGT